MLSELTDDELRDKALDVLTEHLGARTGTVEYEVGHPYISELLDNLNTMLGRAQGRRMAQLCSPLVPATRLELLVALPPGFLRVVLHSAPQEAGPICW